MASEEFKNVERQLKLHLLAIERMFKNPKVTLIVRNELPDGANGDILLTNDNVDKVIECIQQLRKDGLDWPQTN